MSVAIRSWLRRRCCAQLRYAAAAQPGAAGPTNRMSGMVAYGGRRPMKAGPSPHAGTFGLARVRASGFLRALDCRAGVEYRHLDAERRSGVADDLALAVAADGRADPDRVESSDPAPRTAGGRAGRHRGSAPAADRIASLDAARGGGAGCVDDRRPDDAVDAAGAELRARRRLGAERAGVAGDHPRAGAARGSHFRDRAERSQLQRRPRRRPRARRDRGRDGRARARLSF